MIGLVIVAHGPLPDALLESASMIAGDFENIAKHSVLLFAARTKRESRHVCMKIKKRNTK